MEEKEAEHSAASSCGLHSICVPILPPLTIMVGCCSAELSITVGNCFFIEVRARRACGRGGCGAVYFAGLFAFRIAPGS